jgi:hypothetical protein
MTAEHDVGDVDVDLDLAHGRTARRNPAAAGTMKRTGKDADGRVLLGWDLIGFRVNISAVSFADRAGLRFLSGNLTDHGFHARYLFLIIFIKKGWLARFVHTRFNATTSRPRRGGGRLVANIHGVVLAVHLHLDYIPTDRLINRLAVVVGIKEGLRAEIGAIGHAGIEQRRA